MLSYLNKFLAVLFVYFSESFRFWTFDTFFLDFVFVFLSFFSNLSTTSVLTSGVTVSSCCKLSIGKGSDVIKGTRLVIMKTATNDSWFSIFFLYISCLCLNWRIMYTIRNKSSRSSALYFMPHTSGGNSILLDSWVFWNWVWAQMSSYKGSLKSTKLGFHNSWLRPVGISSVHWNTLQRFLWQWKYRRFGFMSL